ncbi:MAG: hypothetical protein ACKVZ0_09630 [Gemmatimonadales bacterium]
MSEWPAKAAMTILLGGIVAAGANAQTIVVSSPLAVFSGIVGGPNPPGQVDSITNSGTAPLTWRIRNPNHLAAWLVVTPHSGGAPTTLGIDANIAGLRAGVYSDTIEVASNDPKTPIYPILVSLTLTDLGRAAAATRYLATYQVELEYIGISGHHVQTAADCQVPVNPNGFDLLVGTVVGIEDPTQNEEVVYRGTLRRSTAMDFCDLRGPVDQAVDCRVTLNGWTPMDVEITVYGEDGRGAYVKATPTAGPKHAQVSGDCDRRELNQVRSDYLTIGDGGASPNGQPIDDPQSLLFASSLARLKVGTFAPQPPNSIWTLRVLRRIP